ncbi:MAG TPA: thiolase family protein [Deltaproteobacteria bacterium]|nr:thiolase family protein [Deltaproteobacteria bacterium]
MGKRVAICAVSQIKNDGDYWYLRFQNMLLPCLEAILEQTGVTFDLDKGIRDIITCSDDVYDARTISNNGVTDVVGAHLRGEEKMAQEAINGLGYAMASILSGHDDVVLFMGHCKETQTESRLMNTNLAFDPFYSRPLGLDFINANAFQAREYQDKSGLTDEHLAKIVVRSRENAKKNPYARENELVTVQDVMKSSMIADPIRELHLYPVTDWAFGMLLCCEERAYEFTDNPVWITGFGNCMDSYFLGDRDLTSNFSLKRAAQRAYEMAGIKDPKKDFDVVELMDSFAYQLPLWAEGVGIVDEGKGAEWIDGKGADDQNVNLSGGMLNGNPIILGGVARALECVLQLRGEAGKSQVKGAKRALAHGCYGAAGQHQAVVVLEK